MHTTEDRGPNLNVPFPHLKFGTLTTVHSIVLMSVVAHTHRYKLYVFRSTVLRIIVRVLRLNYVEKKLIPRNRRL